MIHPNVWSTPFPPSLPHVYNDPPPLSHIYNYVNYVKLFQQNSNLQTVLTLVTPHNFPRSIILQSKPLKITQS